MGAVEINPSLSAAMDYAAAYGWHVVPIHPQRKAPIGDEWQNRATADEDEIVRLWESQPSAGVGVLLGEKSGIVDVECDSPEAKRAFDEIVSECRTPTYRSARGLHRLFRVTDDLPRESILKLRGIECRLGLKDGGIQSVLPPSAHPSGARYEWLSGLSPSETEIEDVPDPLLALMHNEVMEPELNSLNGTGDKQTAIESIRHLARRRVDDYEPWLRVGMALHSVDPSDSMLNRWVEWSKPSDKFEPGVCESKWKSFNGSGLKLGSLLYWARLDTGWTPGPHHEPLVPMSVVTLGKENPHLADPLIDGILRRGEVGNVIAPPKFGKSWLAYGLTMSVASGGTWLGLYPCRPGRVLIIDNELHKATIAQRIPAVADAMGLPADVLDSVDVVSLRGRLRSLPELHELVETIGQDYAAVVLDAWYRMIPPGVSENDNAGMAQLYNTVDRYAAMTGAAWILIHHSSKGGQADKRITDVGAGAGSQSRAADTHLILREHEEDGYTVLDAAVRSFPPVDPVVLQWVFPVWVADDAMDPSKMRGKLTQSEQRQSDRDRAGMEKILEALGTGTATVREIRRRTGLSKDRADRLLDALESSGRIRSEKTTGKGGKARLYQLVGATDHLPTTRPLRGGSGGGGSLKGEPTTYHFDPPRGTDQLEADQLPGWGEA